jgi:glutaredoxin
MNSSKAAGQIRVTVYSSSNCANCRQLKNWLQQHNIRFTDLNIEKNRRAFTDFQRLGSRGVPVLLIGKSRIDGFQPKRVEQELRRQGLIKQ